MSNYRILEKPSEQLGLFTNSECQEYHFHDMANYEKILPKDSINIKEFRPK